MHDFLKSEDGQLVVEFALVAPILLLILCGIIDFGWIFSAQLATNNCAREGARYASTCSSYDMVEYETNQKVIATASDLIRGNLVTSVFYNIPSNPGSGDVTVSIESEVNALTIVADTIFGNEKIKLSSSVTMKVG